MYLLACCAVTRVTPGCWLSVESCWSDLSRHQFVSWVLDLSVLDQGVLDNRLVRRLTQLETLLVAWNLASAWSGYADSPVVECRLLNSCLVTGCLTVVTAFQWLCACLKEFLSRMTLLHQLTAFKIASARPCLRSSLASAWNTRTVLRHWLGSSRIVTSLVFRLSSILFLDHLSLISPVFAVGVSFSLLVMDHGLLVLSPVRNLCASCCWFAHQSVAWTLVLDLA